MFLIFKISAAANVSPFRISLTDSAVASGCFHKSLDSPRTPKLNTTTVTSAPSLIYFAIVPPERQTKSAAWALTTNIFFPLIIVIISFTFQIDMPFDE